MDPNQGQAVEQEPELTPEQIAAEAVADADFEAAFTNARSEELGTEGTTSSSTSEASAAEAPGEQEQHSTTDLDDLDTDPEAGTPVAEGGSAAAEDEDAPVVITKRQLAELTSVHGTVAALQAELRQAVDSTNGRFGSIQQTLKQVKEQASQGIRPSFAQMEAMEEVFPELAEVMKRDLERAFGAGNATQPGSEGEEGGEDDQQGDDSDASGADAPGAAPAVNPLEAPEVKKALRAAQLSIVDAKHEGWRALPATPAWQTWRDQLPPDARELLRTTTDAATLSEAIDDFKAWEQKQAAATSASNQRGKRLEHAVPATNGSTGAVRSTVTDDDAFEDGFKSARPR